MATGTTPLDYLLDVMRNPEEATQLRVEAAKAAAPYVHPKLANVMLQGDDERPVRHVFEWLSEPSGSSAS